VSWHLTKGWFGNAPRVKEFRPDPFLPEGWHRVTPQSYAGSGFDFGHHVPPADRTKSAEDYSSVFLMTNIFPQAPELNQIAWAFLEDFTRNQVYAGHEVYVIMGSYGTGGTGAKGGAETIDQGRVTVPARIWRVMVILPEGEGGLDRITPDTRVIAVDLPNDNTVKNSDWGTYRTSVDAIEQATGYDLLSQVPKKIQEVIEAWVDDGPTR
jgi:endonuclease G, mitochondrial